ncbi:AaceriACR157Cp [[Ashbya] aceris (nom. inval.)]|nr:AaceriACR157Cp [[Ashbya] aceris (nom. inval.)]
MGLVAVQGDSRESNGHVGGPLRFVTKAAPEHQIRGCYSPQARALGRQGGFQEQMNVSSFLNRPDTDDTLQNIRKEYLNTKRNLHDLLSSSPTRLQQGGRGAGEMTGNAPPLHYGGGQAEPPQQGEQDDRLRQQLRDYMSNKSRSMPPPAKYPAPGPGPVDGGVQRQLDSQKMMIESLKRELDTQRTINSMLFERLDRLEEEVRYVRHSNRAPPNGAPFRSVNSAPSSSHTNGHVGSYASADDTKVLLGWDQPTLAPGGKHAPPQQHTRTFSNLDDSTARLIQMSAGGKQKW